VLFRSLPHLDQLLSIERLLGIQWIPGAGQPEASEWPEVLARIRKAGKLCQVYVTPEGAKKIVREHGGKGFLFAVNTWKEKPTEESISNFVATLQS